MPEISQFGLEGRLGTDGRLSLIGKDDAGREYTALHCAGADFTPADEALLAATDREHSTPRKAVEFVTGQRERFEKERDYQAEQDFTQASVNVIRTMTLSQQWQWLTGVGPGEVKHFENGSAIPSRRTYRVNSNGLLE